MLISRIGELIKRKGLRPGWIADKLGVSRHTVTNWAKGRSTPPMEKGFELSRLLGVTIEDMYDYITSYEGKSFKAYHKTSGNMYILRFQNGEILGVFTDKNGVGKEIEIRKEHLNNFEIVKWIRD